MYRLIVATAVALFFIVNSVNADCSITAAGKTYDFSALSADLSGDNTDSTGKTVSHFDISII
jgi:hypothetical protein